MELELRSKEILDYNTLDVNLHSQLHDVSENLSNIKIGTLMKKSHSLN